MEPIRIRRVSVWLDSLAPGQGAFAHALDWAGHLDVPLRLLWTRNHATKSAGDTRDLQDGAANSSPSTIIRACAAACDYCKVVLDEQCWCGPRNLGIQEFLQPSELCVIPGSAVQSGEDSQLRNAMGRSMSVILFCSGQWQPMMRVMILNQREDQNCDFFDSVALLCQRFQVRPVVLTAAQSDSDARRWQESAALALSAHGVLADFDAVVGRQVGNAVAWAAQWRRCSHIFFEKSAGASWWRWIGKDLALRLHDAANSMSLLKVPNVAARLDARPVFLDRYSLGLPVPTWRQGIAQSHGAR